MSLSKLSEKIPGEIGWRIREKLFRYTRGTELIIDLIDSCPGGCMSCALSMQGRRDGHRMSIDTFRRILDKLQSETNVRKVQLYRWSDPLVVKNLHEFVEECVSRGLRASTSSFLQYTACEWEKLAMSGLSEFRVSYSGPNMHVYQWPATAEKFLKKFDMVSELFRWVPETEKVMFFHRYKTNLADVEPARRLAMSHGFRFVPFDAIFMVYDVVTNGNYSEEDKKTIAHLLETPEENIARQKRQPKATDFCIMQEEQVTLDAHGRMQLCELMYPPEFRLGDFLSTPLHTLRAKAMYHSMCPRCKAKGVPGYTLIYADPAVTRDPVSEANKGKYK